MRKALILTASFGDGHNAAAHGLRDALRVKDSTAEVKVLDLFASAYGPFNTLMKRGYQGIVRFAPALWSGLFRLFDSPSLIRGPMNSMRRLRNHLARVLEEYKPDVVVSVYPIYAHILAQIFPDGSDRRFRFITVVTDSTSVCSAWFRAPSDLFVVANDETSEVLNKGGVPKNRVQALGFPVSPLFASNARTWETSLPAKPKLLQVINTGKARAGKSLEEILELGKLEMTISVGRNRRLEAKLGERLNRFGDRVRVLGWTNEMPQLLMSHHLLIGKAGGALVQETIAARCPMIVNQVIPGQEEGNAKLIERLGAGAVAGNAAEVPMLVRDAFANSGRKWLEWRENLRKASTPDASLRLADLVLNECDAVEDDQDRINKRLNGLRPAFAGRNEAQAPAVAG